MEPTSDNKDQKSYNPQYSREKKVPMYLIATVITLAVVSVLLGVLLYKMTQERNTAKEDLQYTEAEKTKLEGQLKGLIVEYDSLKTSNDTLNQQIEIEQDKIKKLLSYNASNVVKIKMYKRELETLRQVMRSYIVQIDSLNTKNRQLTEENQQVHTQISALSSKNQELQQNNMELSSTVKIAQKLSAKDIVAEGLNRNSKPKDRASKVEKVRVCFTVRENPVAEAGNKMIFLRIVRSSDEVVLASQDAGSFDFNGKTMAYSAKRELEYEKADIDMCIFWDVSEELKPDTYFVTLYSEGYEIGNTTFVLK